MKSLHSGPSAPSVAQNLIKDQTPIINEIAMLNSLEELSYLWTNIFYPAPRAKSRQHRQLNAEINGFRESVKGLPYPVPVVSIFDRELRTGGKVPFILRILVKGGRNVMAMSLTWRCEITMKAQMVGVN